MEKTTMKRKMRMMMRRRRKVRRKKAKKEMTKIWTLVTKMTMTLKKKKVMMNE